MESTASFNSSNSSEERTLFITLPAVSFIPFAVPLMFKTSIPKASISMVAVVRRFEDQGKSSDQGIKIASIVCGTSAPKV